MSRAAAIAVLALAACSDERGPQHWSRQPLVHVTDSFAGTTFVIELPQGMRKSSVPSRYDVEYGYHADVEGKDRVLPPSVAVGKPRVKRTLAEAIARDPAARAGVLFQEATATGWVYAVANDRKPGAEDFLIRGQRDVEGGALSCAARLYPMRAGEPARLHLPRVARMCASLRPR